MPRRQGFDCAIWLHKARELPTQEFKREDEKTIPKDSQVSFVMTIEGNQVVHPIELIGEASVVRVEETPGSAVRLALECKNPIEQIENYLF